MAGLVCHSVCVCVCVCDTENMEITNPKTDLA